MRIESNICKSLKGWVEMYEQKTGDKFGIPDGFRLIYLASRGFTIYKLDEEAKMIIVYQTCGDAKFWRDSLELIYGHVGYDYIGTIVTRHVKPYIRAFGAEIIKEYDRDGKKRYLCQDEIGRKVIFTEGGLNEKGEPSFLCVQYLKQKAVSELSKEEVTTKKESEAAVAVNSQNGDCNDKKNDKKDEDEERRCNQPCGKSTCNCTKAVAQPRCKVTRPRSKKSAYRNKPRIIRKR
jgi:hypothetical protein